MNPIRCAVCKYWTGNRAEPKQGECRRYPPASAGNVMIKQVTIVNPQGEPRPLPIFALPTTIADHWCGEFSPEIVS